MILDRPAMTDQFFQKLRLVTEGDTLALSFDLIDLPHRILGWVLVFALILLAAPHHIRSTEDAWGIATIGMPSLALVAGLLNRVSIRVNRNGITVARRLTLFPPLRFPRADIQEVCYCGMAVYVHRNRMPSYAVWLRYGNGRAGRLSSDFANIDEAGRAARAIADWLNDVAPGTNPVGCAEAVWQRQQDWVRVRRMVVVMFLVLSPLIGFGVSDYMRMLPYLRGRYRTQARAQEITPLQPSEPAPEYSFEGAFSPEKAMKALWGNYDAEFKESEWDHPSLENAPSNMKDRFAAIFDATDPPVAYWTVWAADSVVAHGKQQWHLYLTARPALDREKRADCQTRAGCAFALGGYVFEKRRELWVLTGADPFIAIISEGVATNPGKIVRWGAESIGVVVDGGGSGQGVVESYDDFYAFYDGRFLKIFRIQTLEDTGGTGQADAHEYSAKWEFGEAGACGVYDLRLTLDGFEHPTPGRYIWDGRHYVHETTKALLPDR
jgi:hypothetical protein